MSPNTKQIDKPLRTLHFYCQLDNNTVGGQEAEAFLCAYDFKRGHDLESRPENQLIKPVKSEELFLIKTT